MTYLFLDTEFNGFGGELISMALVCEDASCWYGALELPARLDPWVAANVVPKIDREPMLKEEFRASLHTFLLQFDQPIVICDWHADAAHFCDMLAGHDYASSLDYECTVLIVKTPPGQPVSSNPHNALADATALATWYLKERALLPSHLAALA